MSYRCKECNHKFDEPLRRHTTYEAEYGVSLLFHDSHPVTFYECPFCGSSDFDEYNEDDEEEEEEDK